MQNYFNTFYCGDALTEHITQELPLQSCKQSTHAAPAKSQGLAEQLSAAQRRKVLQDPGCVLTEELAVTGAALYAPHQPEANSKSGSGMV